MPLTHAELLQLKRWNTPTICNGWEQVTSHDFAAEGFNCEECRDSMPQMGPMVGDAVTMAPRRDPARIELDPAGWGAAIVRLAGLPRVSRLTVVQVALTRLLGD